MGKANLALLTALAATLTGIPQLRAESAEEAEGPLWRGKEVEVTVMMEYVSKLLDKRFIYDPDQLKGRKIAVLSTSRIPKESIYKIFHSILRMNGFVLVEYKDYVRVESASNARQIQTGVFKAGEAAGISDEDRIITRIFQLENANANSMSAVVKQLLHRDYEQAVPLSESNTMVVTGFARNLERVAAVIEASDRPVVSTASEYLELEHAKADEIAKQLQPLLKGFTGRRHRKGIMATRMASSQVIAVPRTNGVILSGTEEEVAELKKLVAELDVPGLEVKTQFLELKFTEASRVVRHLEPLVKAFTSARSRPGPKNQLAPMELSGDPRTNGLVMTGTNEELQAVRELVAKLDVEVPTVKPAVKVFRVQNADAAELVKALQGVVFAEGQSESVETTGAGGQARAVRLAMPDREIQMIAQGGAIIVRAPTATLERIGALLKELDVRRPKVLIEAAIVELTVTKGFDLGVELATVDRPTGDPRPFADTAVGISRLLDTDGDGIPDAKLPLSGAGLVAGIFKNTYGDIPVLLRALESKAGLRVLAAPMVIADHNEEASFTAADQYPVATFSTTQSTTDVTSFGGFEEAKIQLKIRPNINEEEGYVRLEIEQLVESFQGDPVSANLPPRKISREVKAVLTVPDGRTVAVGGLSNSKLQKSRTGVPVLQHIPILGFAFRGKTSSDVQTRLYVFVNTKILKDLSFEDYEELSRERRRKLDEFMEEQEKSDRKFWKRKGKRNEKAEQADPGGGGTGVKVEEGGSDEGDEGDAGAGRAEDE